jgi:hypothetical protein
MQNKKKWKPKTQNEKIENLKSKAENQKLKIENS